MHPFAAVFLAALLLATALRLWLAWRHMDDLEVVRASLGEQTTVVLRRDTWILAWLYLGTFGSFIGSNNRAGG